MAYNDFQDSKPVSSDDIGDYTDSIRENLMAMRDAFISGFGMPGWDYAPTTGTGTTEQPQYMIWSKGTEQVRLTLTWGSSGGADGNVTQIVGAYSSNSGGSYDTIGTKAIAYDSDGNVTSTTWS